MALFPLAVINDDPPTAIVIAPGAGDSVCDAQASTFRTSSYMAQDARPVAVRIEETDKTTTTTRASERVTHPTASNGLCTTAYRLGSSSALLFSDAKGFAGFRFKWVTDAKDTSKRSWVAEPLACAPSPPMPVTR